MVLWLPDCIQQRHGDYAMCSMRRETAPEGSLQAAKSPKGRFRFKFRTFQTQALLHCLALKLNMFNQQWKFIQWGGGTYIHWHFAKTKWVNEESTNAKWGCGFWKVESSTFRQKRPITTTILICRIPLKDLFLQDSSKDKPRLIFSVLIAIYMPLFILCYFDSMVDMAWQYTNCDKLITIQVTQ